MLQNAVSFFWLISYWKAVIFQCHHLDLQWMFIEWILSAHVTDGQVESINKYIYTVQM
jgi:hypothetical protein